MTVPERLRSVFSENIVDLAPRFADEGYELYLVGGSVRDANPTHSAVVEFKSALRMVFINTATSAPIIPGSGPGAHLLKGKE